MALLLNQDFLLNIDELLKTLERKYDGILNVDPYLTRQLVSFQANKQEPIYRWYKYKEAFSAKLVGYLLNKYGLSDGKILDPFAGAGTAIFAASEQGMDSIGIELLPIGQEIIQTRKSIDNSDVKNVVRELKKIRNRIPWINAKGEQTFNILRITRGAYSVETESQIKKFLWFIDKLEDKTIRQILFFSLLCIIESVSFTRKDGQYLRWDYRSGRTCGKDSFDKGHVYDFTGALIGKIDEIILDLTDTGRQMELIFSPRNTKHHKGEVSLLNGSCLSELPKMRDGYFSGVITSPPYCNRYDYTRTYALELALLGVDEDGLRALRQTMLSCTVENKEKDLIDLNPRWRKAVGIAENHSLLQSILAYLDDLRLKDELNNDGIFRMVKSYFYEMACVIYECHRVLKKSSLMMMVNDNVKYAGVGIPVDLILSSIAEEIGFRVKDILVLPQGKGNSSQQMGVHGREVLRKCIYVWEK
jgi:DNA modification methylase